MTKIHFAFSKVVLMVGLLVIATYTSGCSTESLSTNLTNSKSPHEDGTAASKRQTANYAPFNYLR